MRWIIVCFFLVLWATVEGIDCDTNFPTRDCKIDGVKQVTTDGASGWGTCTDTYKCDAGTKTCTRDCYMGKDKDVDKKCEDLDKDKCEIKMKGMLCRPWFGNGKWFKQYKCGTDKPKTCYEDCCCCKHKGSGLSRPSKGPCDAALAKKSDEAGLCPHRELSEYVERANYKCPWDKKP